MFEDLGKSGKGLWIGSAVSLGGILNTLRLASWTMVKRMAVPVCTEVSALIFPFQAIKDGVIEATIHHEERYLEMKETADVYSTAEPQHQFHSRIGFCMEISKQAMKAMRFPPQSFNENLETAEVRGKQGWLGGPEDLFWVGPSPLPYMGILVLSCIGAETCWTFRIRKSPGSAFQDKREREQQELEFAKEMAEEEDDFA